MKATHLLCLALGLLLGIAPQTLPAAQEPSAKPSFESELLFPLEGWHNHGSCIVEAPNGDLIACWFHGSGERTADDVKIEGARKRKGARTWGPRFTMADTSGYPDTNPAMLVDPSGRLWLFWPAILANQWETALMKYRVSSDYRRDGPPRWERHEVLHVLPGTNFAPALRAHLTAATRLLDANPLLSMAEPKLRDELRQADQRLDDKLYHRLGWMTRAHPVVLAGGRLLVPLYCDTFSVSLMAFTDDWGGSWQTSAPLVGFGNIQPSVVPRKDGSLIAFMRDNGPPPKRLMQSESRDRGKTWSPVVDSMVPNPGAGAEVIRLQDDRWLFIGNDTEDGRHRLAVWISDDEGATWRWKRDLEKDALGPKAGSYSYPSVIQRQDGGLDATYSYHLKRRDLPRDTNGIVASKSIKHVRFNLAWVMAGELSPEPCGAR